MIELLIYLQGVSKVFYIDEVEIYVLVEIDFGIE